MHRIRVSQLAGLLGILAATATLIALTWIGTVTAVRNQCAEAEAGVIASVTNQAAVFQERLRVDLLEIEEDLGVLGHAWMSDPDHFHLRPWRNHLVLFNEMSTEVFLTDESGIVRDDTVADAIGKSVSDREFFRHQAAKSPSEDTMFVSGSMTGVLAPYWHINLARSLRRADGSFAGVIVATLPIDAIGSFYQVANIGTRGLIAVIGLQQGQVRLVVGPKTVDPGSSVAGSDMFDAMRRGPNSVWIGATAFDGIQRVHGFRKLPDRDLAVVVSVDHAEAMQATDTWAKGAYLFAAGTTLLLLVLAWILIQALEVARRRATLLARERAELAQANTELAEAKARADHKAARLEATLSGMTDGVVMLDGDMRLLEWNQRFPEIAGVPAEILRVDMPVEDILRAQAQSGQFGPVDIEAEVARRATNLRAGIYSDTIERTRPDGAVLELRRNQLPDGGFVTLYTDITERRESLNALRAANALAEAARTAMSRFVAIVSHEIRTPLNALLNTLDLLADSGIAGAQRVLLDMAQQSGQALLALTNDILEMSRMEVGQLTLRPTLFALRPLIASIVDMFGAQAGERRIVLRMSIAQDVPDQLYEDAGRLRQVLINLLSNAIKFAASGEVRVTADVYEVSGQRLLRLAVRDQGPIISKGDSSHLFEPFSRLDENAGPIGTGLGLAICRHLVALMDGEIGCSVWQTAGRDAGNEFWLTIPIRPLPDTATANPTVSSGYLRRKLPRTRVLLVEDIFANQFVTATLLRREGHSVDLASSGGEAISAVESRPYDLILMDIFMPGINGLETARRIRGMQGPAGKVPILALTANAWSEDQEVYAAAGMNGTLGKPVSLHELLDAIAKHVWPHRGVPLEVLGGVQDPPVPSVLSSSRLAELRAALPATKLSSLVEEFLLELSERFSFLREALGRRDADQVHAHAHAMAGMAAQYGMAVLDTRLRVLMRIGDELPPDTAELARQVEWEMLRAARALREAFRIEVV